MRIGLIEACDPDWQYKRFSYPLQLGYLASYLQKHSPPMEVALAEEESELYALKPDVVGISSYSMNYGLARDMAARLKERLGVPVILGGCHISALPGTFSPVFDAAVTGEGEETFRLLLESLERHGRLLPGEMEKIEGLLYLDGGRLAATPPRLPINPIDKIPPPSRQLFKVRSGTHYISTSRGCPFDCLFCAPCVIWSKPRNFTGAYVGREIGLIVKQFANSITHLMVVDDLFIAHRKRLEVIRDFYVSSGLNKVLAQQCNVRADLIDEKTASLLADMNFQTVNFGAESGSDRILKYYNKKASVADNRRAIEVLFQAGIRTIPSFIIGAPEETEEDLEATLSFIEENQHLMAGFEVFPMVPMPGSRLWSQAMEKGIVDYGIDWARLEPLLLDFDPDRYIYMTERISREKFVEYVGRFQEIYKKYNPLAMEFREKLLEMKRAEKAQGREG
jgi:radical SAM superfamily enzyme YgiQ (UPF0313 family)